MPLPMIPAAVQRPLAGVLALCRSCTVPISAAVAAKVRHYSTHAIRGRATAEATRAYCERTATPLSTVLEPAGWEIGALGFGGYRVHGSNDANREALTRAWRSGVNVVDTAPNFTDGGSERLIGTALGDLTAAGEVKREELVLMSKFGYIQGSMLHEVKKSGAVYDSETQVSDNVWHCLAPDFMEMSLTHSLRNMGVEHIDMFLVSNPEVFAKNRGVAHVYDRLASLFCALENEVARGRIGYYGVASNALSGAAAAAAQGQGLSVEQLVRVAKDAAGDAHHFRMIQYPFNVYEHGAILPPGQKSLTSTARELGLWQFTQRTLNAVTPARKIRRLVTYNVESDGLADIVLADFQKAVALEEELTDKAAENVLDGLPKGMTSLALDLTNHTDLLSDLFVLEHYLDKTVLPAVQALCARVVSADAEWADWSKEYEQTMGSLRDRLILAAQDQCNQDNRELGGLLNSVCPALKTSPDIAQKAARVSLSSGVDCVLVGMTKPAYVDAMVAAARAEPALSSEDVERIVTLPVFTEVDKSTPGA